VPEELEVEPRDSYMARIEDISDCVELELVPSPRDWLSGRTLAAQLNETQSNPGSVKFPLVGLGVRFGTDVSTLRG